MRRGRSERRRLAGWPAAVIGGGLLIAFLGWLPFVVAIVALACTPPSEAGRPVEDWTPRELAEEAVKRQVVSAISPRSVGRFLKAGPAQAPSEPLLVEHQGG